VTPAPRSGVLARPYTPLPLALGNRVPTSQHPRILAALGVVFAIAAVTAAIVGAQRGGAANVLAIVLVLGSLVASYRAIRLAGRYEVGLLQRGALLRCLGRLEALDVRVAAVNEPDAIAYARGLRDVVQEAGWPAMGVFRCNGSADGTGVTLVVRNVLTPPAEAVALMETLRRTGALAVWGHKPDLPDDRRIEIRIGYLQ
jgi:hypothetical protein